MAENLNQALSPFFDFGKLFRLFRLWRVHDGWMKLWRGYPDGSMLKQCRSRTALGTGRDFLTSDNDFVLRHGGVTPLLYRGRPTQRHRIVASRDISRPPYPPIKRDDRFRNLMVAFVERLPKHREAPKIAGHGIGYFPVVVQKSSSPGHPAHDRRITQLGHSQGTFEPLVKADRD